MPLGAWTVGGVPPGMDSTTVKRLRFPKSPTDVTPVTCDFRGALAAVDCDKMNIAFAPTSQVFRNDGAASDLVVAGQPAINEDATRVTVWTVAGTAGYEYLIMLTIQSIDGQILERSFILPVNLR